MGSPDPVVALLLDMGAAIQHTLSQGHAVSAIDVDEATFRLIQSLRELSAERAGPCGAVRRILGRPLRVNRNVQAFALIHEATAPATSGPPERPEAGPNGDT